MSQTHQTSEHEVIGLLRGFLRQQDAIAKRALLDLDQGTWQRAADAMLLSRRTRVLELMGDAELAAIADGHIDLERTLEQLGPRSEAVVDLIFENALGISATEAAPGAASTSKVLEISQLRDALIAAYDLGRNDGRHRR